MISEQLEIINLLSDGFNSERTINQISKSINKSYAFTNKYVRELIHDGILSKKIVGSAILCSLNLKNELTRSLLAYNSIVEKNKFFETLKPGKKETLQNLAASLESKAFYTCYLENSNVFIVADNDVQIEKIDGFNVKLQTKTEFKLSVNKVNFSNIIVLKNNELFWELVEKMV
ncbi:MAG: hypothetical protein V1859_01960 [archaeon]